MLNSINQDLIDELALDKTVEIKPLGKDRGGEVFTAQLVSGETILLKRNIDPKAIPLISRAIKVRREVNMDQADLLRFVSEKAPEAHGWYATSYIQGEALSNFATLDLDLIVDLAKSMCVRVFQLQDQGVAHRNFKPANVVRRPDGEVGLIDIDTLEHLGEHYDPLLGNPWCMPPERYQGKGTTHGSEIHSVGMVTANMMGEKFMEALYPPLATISDPKLLRSGLIKDKTEGNFVDADAKERADSLVTTYPEEQQMVYRGLVNFVIACANQEPKDRPQNLQDLNGLL
jgi:serine/threonine protein kinase